MYITATIDPSATLWTTAYGTDVTPEARQNNIIPPGNPTNLAAHKIIEKDIKDERIAKVITAVGSAMIVLGIVAIIIYANSEPLSRSELLYAEEMTQISIFLTLAGVGVALGGGIAWEQKTKRIEEAKNLPITELVFRLGKDLLDAESSEVFNYYERLQLLQDCHQLGTFLKSYKKGQLHSNR